MYGLGMDSGMGLTICCFLRKCNNGFCPVQDSARTSKAAIPRPLQMASTVSGSQLQSVGDLVVDYNTECVILLCGPLINWIRVSIWLRKCKNSHHVRLLQKVYQKLATMHTPIIDRTAMICDRSQFSLLEAES